MARIYRYRGKDSSGNIVFGSIERNTMDAAADLLVERGIVPIDIREESVFTKGKRRLPVNNKYWSRWSKKIEEATTKVKPEQVQIFCRQLANLLDAGVPVLHAFNKLAFSENNIVLRKILIRITDEIAAGQTLATAFGRYPKIFPPLMGPMLNIGEHTGKLSQVLEYLSVFLEKDIENRRRIKGALNYPLFVLAFGVIAAIGMSYYVVPKFATMFYDMNLELPIFTRIILKFSDFVTKYIALLIGGSIGLLALFKFIFKFPKAIVWKDKYLLKLPILGKVLLKATVSQFAWTLSLMLKSGVPMLSALSLTSNTLTNRYFAREIEEVRRLVERGESMSQTMIDRAILPTLAEQMIEVAEESQQMEGMLTNIAKFYDVEVQYFLEHIGEIIEPVILLVIGGLVLILILGIYFPMWEMVKAVEL